MDKVLLFSAEYSITNYNDAANLIIEKALKHDSFGVSALAVHGLIESVKSKTYRNNLQKIDLIVPDGQPIIWAINSFYKLKIKERVAGPILTLHVLKKANEHEARVFLYGSTYSTLKKVETFISEQYPNIVVCGIHPDRFREATSEEDFEDILKIENSCANLVLVGRGCPRQEIWVADHIGKVNAPMMAIGAAFDFMAGNIQHAPYWMKKYGLEWLYRLIQDPKRLWKRYLVTNTYFIFLCLMHKIGIRKLQL